MLYNDTSFMYNYTAGVVLRPEDYLFLEVTLQAQDTLAHDMLLAVMSCWATGTVDAGEDRKAFFLKDGCVRTAVNSCCISEIVKSQSYGGEKRRFLSIKSFAWCLSF